VEIVQVLKALADETRLRMLNLLTYGELCVCDIENTLGIQQSNASRHLTKLKQSGIIESEKKSQWVYFRFNQETLQKYPFLNDIIDELSNLSICKDDLQRLHKYKKTGNTC